MKRVLTIFSVMWGSQCRYFAENCAYFQCKMPHITIIKDNLINLSLCSHHNRLIPARLWDSFIAKSHMNERKKKRYRKDTLFLVKWFPSNRLNVANLWWAWMLNQCVQMSVINVIAPTGIGCHHCRLYQFQTFKTSDKLIHYMFHL